MPQRKEHLTLPEHLSEANQELVATLPFNIIKQYEQGLDSILRGQARVLRPYNSDFCQTNLGHTANMLISTHQIAREYPEITSSLNMQEIERQTVLHDGSETYPGAHLVDEAGKKIDLPTAGAERDTEEAQKMKRRESIIFVLCMVPQMPEKSRDTLRRSGLRYFRRNPRDLETQFTKMVDGIEATFETGLDEIFGTYPRYGHLTPPAELVDHLGKTVPKTFIPFYNLARELPKKGRDALIALADVNFKKLEAAGYEELSHYFRLIYTPLIKYPY